MATKVSVLIPCYNVEKYIRECMDSVCGQTLKDLEIICINDGSTDSTLKILKEYAEKDNRVVIIDKKNSGYGASMNMGLDRATGEYIGIVESDDYAEKDMFETLYQLAQKDKLDVVKSNFYVYFAQKHKNRKCWYLPRLLLHQVFKPLDHFSIFYCMPSVWSAIYRTDFLKKNQIRFLESPGASFQDTAFNFKVWVAAECCTCCEQAFIHYRQDNENSSVKSKSKVFCVCNEWHEAVRYAQANGVYDKLKYWIPRLKWKTYYWNFQRLGGKSAWQFLKVFAREFREYERENLIQASLFKPKDLQNMRVIIRHPMLFYIKNYFEGIRQCDR